MSPLSKDETGHGSSILQRNSPISLIWLQWETAWLAALLLHIGEFHSHHILQRTQLCNGGLCICLNQEAMVMDNGQFCCLPTPLRQAIPVITTFQRVHIHCTTLFKNYCLMSAVGSPDRSRPGSHKVLLIMVHHAVVTQVQVYTSAGCLAAAVSPFLASCSVRSRCLRRELSAQCAAFWPDMYMAPKVGPMRGAPSSSATCKYDCRDITIYTHQAERFPQRGGCPL